MGSRWSTLGRFAIAALALLSFSGGLAQAKTYPPLPVTASGEYRLDVGDEVRINVYGLDAITNTYTLSDDGSISLPLIDKVQAGGATVSELQSRIASKLLERQILNTPSVNVQVTKSRPFYILGEVKKPGEYIYRPGMTVLTAISVAGGFTFRADTKKLLISRKVGNQSVTGRVNQDMPIQPGDTIQIPEGWF
jgi:polysaccharide biosynthesis/export protein